MMQSYRDVRKTWPDFRVRYQFFSEAEDGRKELPFQHIRSDFLYAGDDPLKDGIWCIWPEFLSADGAVLPEDDQRVSREGLADMYILNSELRAEHARRIRVGTKGYFVEGSKKTAACEVISALGLSDGFRMSNMMRTGFRSGYWIAEWSGNSDPNLADLVSVFPAIVLGHRVAIASWDSGPFEPTQAEYAKGWGKRNEVAISPIVNEASELSTPGFDEWYVYAGEVPEVHHRAFVNRLGFAPLDQLHPESQDFWAQVETLQPLHVVGAGTPTMFFATQDEALFRKVIHD